MYDSSTPFLPSRKRLIAGLVIIGGGVLLLLGNLGIVSIFAVLRFWPMVFMLIGMILLLRGGHARRYLTGASLLALGIVMTLDNAGYLEFKLHDWWPVFVIYGGLMLMLPRRCQHRCRRGEQLTRDTENGNTIHRKLLMTGNELRCEAENFSGGELSLVMSGMKLDLRAAQLQGDAVLKVEMMLSGLELRVPADWQVHVEVAAAMGGVENKSTPPLQTDKRLYLRGEAVLSGIEIRN